MKKITALILAFVLALSAALPALAAETTLVDSGGVELILLDCSVTDTSSVTNIHLEIRGINNTDHRVWVDLKDVKVDGVPVVSSTRSIQPHTDTGTGDPLLYSVWGDDENDGGAGSDAIRSGETLTMLVDVTDNDTYEHLVSENVTISLSASSDTGTTDPALSGTGSAATAPPYIPASYNFQTLKSGSSGQAVIDLQQRLTDLGYLCDRVDGKYGTRTATAVMSFCTQHGLAYQDGASPDMQSVLYSSNAEYYVEPWVPLIIGPRSKWDNPIYANLDNGTFYIQIVNRSSTRTIRGYELYYYFTDLWGERYTGDDGIVVTRKTSAAMTIDPGYVVYSDPIVLYPFSWICTVWVGVHKIIFDDGEIREIAEEDIDYYSCDIK